MGILMENLWVFLKVFLGVLSGFPGVFFWHFQCSRISFQKNGGWEFLEVFNGGWEFWGCLMVVGSFWRCLMVVGSFWGCLMVVGSFGGV